MGDYSGVGDAANAAIGLIGCLPWLLGGVLVVGGLIGAGIVWWIA